MLELKQITKDYKTGEDAVHALRGIDIKFRKAEFVSILGPSGCGKTTMLNIIGGLDQYTTGDLIINGKSTRQFKDRDWDSYRNHSVGFVFQSYNLIPHQTVLENVELALTLSGVSKKERRARAVEVLHKVGLHDKLKSKPNELSGGQMQRVAIARALINDPEILLADEPTGALDTVTSVQIMSLLEEIAKDRLIVMVTHNPELAEQYSTRIIKLLDGTLIDDSNPFSEEEERAENRSALEYIDKNGKTKKTSMSFFTALSLSFRNLMTKKARTFMISLAGSIGIIGIALILAMSSGFQTYIDKVQEDTLSTYPITIQQETVDMTGLLATMMGANNNQTEHDMDKIYSNDIMMNMFESIMSQVYTNNLKDFKKHLDADEDIKASVNAIQYGYSMELDIYASDTSQEILKVNPSTLFEDVMGSMAESFGPLKINEWSEMLDNQELLQSQYDLLDGKWPANYNEVVLVANDKNEISDYVLYVLGLKEKAELEDMFEKLMNNEPITITPTSYTYEQLLALTYKLVLSTDYYAKSGSIWEDKREDPAFLKSIVDNAIELKIVGIIKPNKNATATSISTAIGYTKALTEEVIDRVNRSAIVKQQIDNPETNVFTGRPLATKPTMAEVLAYVETLPEPQKTQAMEYINSGMPEEEIIAYFDTMLKMAEIMAYVETLPEPQKTQALAIINSGISPSQIITYFASVLKATYEDNIRTLGVMDKENPSKISLYPKDFASKDKISKFIEDYNKKMEQEETPENAITYTDFIGLMMSSISTIINAISYVLIAFVAISLVVSSIMIGIITYISVLERVKEIGILRSVGASKRDISRVFNAETLIIGLVAGGLGILITLLLTIPLNIIIGALAGIHNLAKLPLIGALILIAISMLLTFVAGLIPSKIAAKKDPVEALRSE